MDADHIDPVRRRLREGAIQKPPEERTPEERREIRALKTAQRAFQREYCPKCVYYSLRRNDFVRKGCANNPVDCFWHRPDILGVCACFEKRSEPWYAAMEAYCAKRTEAHFRALRVVAHFVASVMNRVGRR